MTTSDCIIKIQHNGPPSTIRCKCMFVSTSSYNAEELLAQSGANNRGQATFPTTLEVEPFRAAETEVEACPPSYRGMALSQASKRVSPSRALVPGTSVLSLIFAPE